MKKLLSIILFALSITGYSQTVSINPVNGELYTWDKNGLVVKKPIYSITRTPGKDSIIYYIAGVRFAIKDSTGGGLSQSALDDSMTVIRSLITSGGGSSFSLLKFKVGVDVNAPINGNDSVVNSYFSGARKIIWRGGFLIDSLYDWTEIGNIIYFNSPLLDSESVVIQIYPTITDITLEGPPPIFSPRDSAGLVLWLKADTLTALSDNDPISTWFDASGNGNNATQSGSNRPLYKTGQINSLPVVRFDGSNDFFNLTSTINPASAYSVFIVYKKRTTGVLFPTIANDANNVPNAWFEYNDGNGYFFTNINHQRGTADFTSYKTISQVGEFLWVNGSSLSLSNESFSGASSNQFNVVGRKNAFYADGDIVEIIYYDHTVTTTLRTAIETYLQNKYGHY